MVVEPILTDIPQMTSKFVEIVPLVHRQGNSILPRPSDGPILVEGMMDAVAQHFQGHGRLPVLGENNGTNPGARQRPGVNPSVAWLPGDS